MGKHLLELYLPREFFRINAFVYISTTKITKNNCILYYDYEKFVLIYEYFGFYVYDYKDYSGRSKDFSIAKDCIFEFIEGIKENNMNLINVF